jgi:hypothetical protein
MSDMMANLNIDQFRASADLPERAKQYLDLLEDSGSSVASQQRHLLLMAANEATRHISTASKAASLISSPLDCLANILAEVSTDAVMQGINERQSGKKLWGKLRSTFLASSALKSALKTQDDSSICSKRRNFDPLQKKFMQLIVGSVVSNVVVGAMHSVIGGVMDPSGEKITLNHKQAIRVT